MIDAAIMTGMPRTVESAFDEVVRRRETQVLRTAYRILGNWADAEDVAQEVFVRLHRHGLDFAAEAALGSWLYRVTVNLCFDRTRRAKPAEPLTEHRDGSVNAEASVLREEQKQRLMTALARLPEKERAAVVLREIEGLETAEVAEILGSSEVTVRSQISRALDRLRGWMEAR
ncbi:MAG: RNA polymerase sigma factor [Acidobacteria bacterium]|nr:RNA polymerase sigma factor [Acidobacteriota bacterium]